MELLNLPQLAQRIDAIIHVAKSHNNPNAFLQVVFHASQEHLITRATGGYALLKGAEATATFLLNNWSFQETAERNLESLTMLSGLLKNNFVLPTGKHITEKQIATMFQLADYKLNLTKRLLSANPIAILQTDSTCRYANALYYINFNPNILVKDLILLTTVADERVPPEFALLHELGHMVHTRITNKSFVPPPSFKKLHSIIFKYVGGTPPAKITKDANLWFAEWFADCFAIAVLHQSEHAHLDYHTEISKEDRDEITQYMVQLIFSS